MSAPSAKSSPPGAIRQAPLPQLVDELGALAEKVLAGNRAEEQAKPLKKQIAEIMNLAPGDSAIAEGTRYQCVISEQQNAREITDMGILFDALGRETFLANCSFPLSKVDELLPDAGALLKSERTGPRKFKLIRKLIAAVKGRKKAA